MRNNEHRWPEPLPQRLTDGTIKGEKKKNKKKRSRSPGVGSRIRIYGSLAQSSSAPALSVRPAHRKNDRRFQKFCLSWIDRGIVAPGGRDRRHWRLIRILGRSRAHGSPQMCSGPFALVFGAGRRVVLGPTGQESARPRDDDGQDIPWVGKFCTKKRRKQKERGRPPVMKEFRLFFFFSFFSRGTLRGSPSDASC